MKKIQKIIIKLCVVCAMCVYSDGVFAWTDLTASDVAVTTNTTWTLANSPYVVDLVSIDNGAVLTLEPGVIVKFTDQGFGQSAHLYITDGAMVANGTEVNPIIFTSYKDDVGGDTNGDGNLTSPQPMDWYALSAGPNNTPLTPLSVFNNVEFRYSGSALWLNNGTLTNVLFRDNWEALFLMGDEPIVVQNLIFQNNSIALQLYEDRELTLNNLTFNNTNDVALLLMEDSHFICNGCNFLGGSNGIMVFDDADLTLTNSLIENYTGAGIFNQNAYQSLNPEPEDNEINISNSEIRNNGIGIQFDSGGYGAIVNNLIHDNDTFGVKIFDNDYPAVVDLRNNWWGHESGPHEVVGNPNGQGDNLQVQFIPYSPWTGQLSSMTLHQYKMDGEFELSEGNTNMSDKFVFKAKGSLVVSPRKIEVEIKPHAQSFDGLNTHVSDFQSNTEELSVDVNPVVKGSYKWRARILDSSNTPGGWIEFGQTAGGVDFISKPIPHYTQNQSIFPNFEDTQAWSQFPYANGSGNYTDTVTGKKGCGQTIGACGCALTSAVMVLRYYDITNAFSDNVDPLALNEWLNGHNGYGHRGDVDWYKVSTYSGNQIKFADRTEGMDNTKLDNYLNQQRPAIAYMKSTRKIQGTRGGGHFLVIGNKLQNTYEIRDPANYDTYTLDDQPVEGKKIRTYFNGYDGLRLFQPSNGIAQAYTKIHMASPAEILVTDSLGRAVGKNPITGQSFQEIPGALYVSESINSPDDEDSQIDTHEWKTAYIPNLGSSYDVDVFGTGDGAYTLDIDKVTSGNQETSLLYNGVVVENQIQPFSLTTGQNEIHLKDEKLDISAPALLLSLAKAGDSKNWKLDGVDENMPITKNILNPERIFSVEDRYGNKTEIDFDDVPGYRIPAIGKINLELNHVTINGTAVQIPYTWISYDWNTSAGATTMFKQVFSIDQIFIDAVYTQATNQTVVSITNGNSTQIVTLPKLRILKFKILPNGQPSYEL